jgi:hypothetical protein
MVETNEGFAVCFLSLNQILCDLLLNIFLMLLTRAGAAGRQQTVQVVIPVVAAATTTTRVLGIIAIAL